MPDYDLAGERDFRGVIFPLPALFPTFSNRTGEVEPRTNHGKATGSGEGVIKSLLDTGAATGGEPNAQNREIKREID